MSIFADRRRFLERTSGALALGLVGAAPARIPAVDAELLAAVRRFERCRSRLVAVLAEWEQVDAANPCLAAGGTRAQHDTAVRFEETTLRTATADAVAAQLELCGLLRARDLRAVVVGGYIYTDIEACDLESDTEGPRIPLARVAGLEGGGRC